MMNHFQNARYVFAETVSTLASAPYVTLRPTSECGDFTFTAPICDSEEFQIRVGRAYGPSELVAFFDDGCDAIECVEAIKAAYPHIKVWVDSHEALEELTSPVWPALAYTLSEHDEDWDLVAQVAAGGLSNADPCVIAAGGRDLLIAAALTRV